MNISYKDFIISDDKELIQTDRVCELLGKTYWAEKRSRETIILSIKNSFCFGVYKDDIQVGFARCITDYATTFYLADVIIDEDFRGRGLGKALIKFITEHENFKSLIGLLGTRDAHGLYEKYGSCKDEGTAMRKMPWH